MLASMIAVSTVVLAQERPADFTRFEFAGHQAKAEVLNRYLWYHFSNRQPRSGYGTTLFNKEYLSISDPWMSGAMLEDGITTAQDSLRGSLLAIKLSDEGYVHTHQHLSHAYDYGWPFPLWTQVPGGAQGVTVGWHFQDESIPPGMWVWGYLKGWNDPRYFGETATQGWGLDGLESLGTTDAKWKLRVTGNLPALVTPEGMGIDALNAPYIQCRWNGAGEGATIEWLREGDEEFGPDRRVSIARGDSDFEHIWGAEHWFADMHEHPLWQGKITRLRICPDAAAALEINSIFTCYDTRHPINNPIYILSCWRYFRWTGDDEFLATVMPRVRRALRYQQTVMGGLDHGFIRNPWPGHDGRPGYTVEEDGSKTFNPGHGIGNNYYDLVPFGGDDMYSTSQYYASLLAVAELEEASARGDDVMEPSALCKHAARVKRVANRKFWNRETGRFVGWIDADGVAYDYGFTFVNLDAIWYGIASRPHAREIMAWISGERIVEGDTSTGDDIYRWRFGPRATTRRNVEAYGQGWTAPESIPWGGQIQDGGGVLGFSFHDLMARLNVYGPDDAWKRLGEVLDWEKEVHAAGGYREYYADGSRGTTLQGGGPPGGIGLDREFHESSMVPAIVTEGFLGLKPTADGLEVSPRMPSDCPMMAIRNLTYRGVVMDIEVDADAVVVALRERPDEPVRIRVAGATQEIVRAGEVRIPR